VNTSHFDTFLAPIELPRGPMMKLVYAMTRRQFGKVLTPLKVFSARLPLAFGLFYSKISKLDKKLLLSPETAMLVREQVARTNVCLFCIDIGRLFTIKASMNQAKFDALDRVDQRQEGQPRDLSSPGRLLFRTLGLRDRMARRQRTSLQRYQYRS
jgi:hypothetical protein